MRRRADAAVMREFNRSAADLSSDGLSARPAFDGAAQPADPSPARHVTVPAGAGLRQVRQLSVAAGVSLEHDPEKWVPVFPRDKREAFARRSCSNKELEQDDDSKKSHLALVRKSRLA